MNVRRRLIPTTAAAGALALGLMTLSACSSSNAADKNSNGKLDVVASFYPMQFLAEQIGGEHVAVSTLTKPGVEPHDLELSPKQAAQLGEADFIVYLKGLQPAVDEAVEQSGVKNTADAAALTHLEEHGTEVGHEEHAREEEGHDHGEAAGDPHIWLDPVKYAEVAKGVGKALEKADPDNAAAYQKNTKTLVGKLGGLNTKFENGLKNTTTRTFITTHSAFGYLAERYGLEQEGISGLDPDSEPSPARMKDLQKIAKQEKVSTVFFETLVSDKTAKTLAGDTGLKTDVLDPLEGITDRSKGADYLAVMESNLTALQKALGAK
ncbi:metal ABC transporter substrate-binding protein [Streptomyces sp. H27-C3]|uniref:metal ABC transporter substrate-binding protein n=1 Tax=Streptomyces sp. H27-C3 TaxID=3046305 RepID=UPI0024B95EAE|nr:metal ABC transporter substrate-binding protein [Streptomyces sp. H27-C3]MDJ0464497.1 metal ABC transporter substrate-binding protein [Streptomyces sp. H27-C3]